MAMDTIEKIREAELASDAAEKNAVVEADRILAEAEDAAAALKSDLTREAKAKAEGMLKEASDKSDAILGKAEEDARSGASALRSAVEAKKQDAVKLILDDLTA